MLVNGHSSWAVLLGVGNNGMQAEFRIGELDTCYDCSEHPETSKIEQEGENGHGNEVFRVMNDTVK